MAKSNDETHQTNGQQLSYSYLGTGIKGLSDLNFPQSSVFSYFTF